MKTNKITSAVTQSISILRNQFNKGMDEMSSLALSIEQEQYETTQSKSFIRECLDGIAALHQEAIEMNAMC